ncbi:putative Zinc-finger containing protein [Leptomonas seymouri]|uniref:Putative Zinc-finger containing protein n=1 Tax=Leptomonas seymouri TaxID=5684 RepID=A0A0N1PGN4_LEPSE|nr:putative Zinc-finger containing protein [Leptomonas seymouri]|eukprot:KPI90708.1 putative Zinc-finger containing protein [Leptomonas seymouri]
MVSFTCNNCQDVVKKPKVQSHASSCGTHSFACVDCMRVFDLETIKAHTSCVTEEDKYQGKWKQKLSSNNGTGKSGEAPRGVERPPRAPMNDLSSSDDSDDDWVKTSSKNARKGVEAKKSAAAAAVVAPVRRKNPRPGVSPSSDDEDNDGVPLSKKLKTARSASTTPKTRPAAPQRASPGSKAVKAPAQEVTEGEDGRGQRPAKDTPLLLPRSTTSTDCVVPSFVLGPSAEVAEMVEDVLAEKGATSMRSKDLALGLVDRYAKRIAKSVRHAVDAAVELGALKLDKNGSVTLASVKH